jgi:hypothetical protein
MSLVVESTPVSQGAWIWSIFFAIRESILGLITFFAFKKLLFGLSGNGDCGL